jgi:hypothetical protein
MKALRIIIPFLCLAPLDFAQLTTDQKTSDFLQLVGLYAKNYGPYEESATYSTSIFTRFNPGLPRCSNRKRTSISMTFA